MPDNSPWPIPPHVQVRDFLPSETHQRLLQWVLGREDHFSAATIVNQGSGTRDIVDSEFRTGMVSRDLGPFQALLEGRLRAALPALANAAGVTGLESASIELELAAHGDGAHYNAHLDIPVGPGRRPVGAERGQDRVLSAVYYFHDEPKGFSGGELRLFRLNIRPGNAAQATAGDYVDIPPIQNSLVAFPSWAAHEVRTVHCPSRQFRDYRFALNCWFCRPLGASA